MPKFKSREDFLTNKQQTTSGLWISAGEIDHSDNDKTDWATLQEDFVKMRNGHALASTTIDILKYPILQSNWRIEGKNKEVNYYVEFVLENLYKGFDYFKRHKLLALDFGLSMHEMVVEKGYRYGGKLHNRPVWFNPIQNETINQFHYNEIGLFTGIEHERREPEGATEFINIEADQLEWWTFNEEYNDIRGRSLYRPIRKLWTGQEKIFNSMVQRVQRGAGIPVIKTMGEPGSQDQSNIEEVGRTISQLKNGYVAINSERMDIDLIEPKGQQDAQSLLDWTERQMVFNTLSQFMVAGIGQNGSRAATGEHKTSYEMAASVILNMLERNMQALVNRIVHLSAYGKISPNEYPRFSFDAITQVDLSKTATDMRTLIDSRIVTKQREDEEFLREMFGMPELMATTKMAEPEETKISMFEAKPQSRSLSQKKERKIDVKMLEHESRVFSLQSAIDHYEEMELMIAKAIDTKIHDYILDIEKQLTENRKKDIHIRKAIRETLIDDILELYEKGFNKGEVDVEKEVNKITSKSLQVSKKEKKGKRKIIDKLVNKLFFDVKTGIENKMETVSDEYIKNKGGLKDVLVGFELGFKRDKDKIKTIAENGYTDGRGQKLEELSDNISTYLYSAVMDKNTCSECEPFDGLPFTLEEIKEAGLNLQSPVNPNCLGDSRDRCQLIPLTAI